MKKILACAALAVALSGCVWMKDTLGLDVSLSPPRTPAEAVFEARGQYVSILVGVNATCPAVTETGPCTRANLTIVDNAARATDAVLDRAEGIVRDPLRATSPEAVAAAAEAKAAVARLDNSKP